MAEPASEEVVPSKVQQQQKTSNVELGDQLLVFTRSRPAPRVNLRLNRAGKPSRHHPLRQSDALARRFAKEGRLPRHEATALPSWLRLRSLQFDASRIRFDDEFSSSAITTRRSNRLHCHLKRCCAAEQILSELLIPIIRIYNPSPVLSTWSGHVRLPVQLRHRPSARRSSRSIRVGDGDDGFFFNRGANR